MYKVCTTRYYKVLQRFVGRSELEKRWTSDYARLNESILSDNNDDESHEQWLSYRARPGGISLHWRLSNVLGSKHLSPKFEVQTPVDLESKFWTLKHFERPVPKSGSAFSLSKNKFWFSEFVCAFTKNENLIRDEHWTPVIGLQWSDFRGNCFGYELQTFQHLSLAKIRWANSVGNPY